MASAATPPRERDSTRPGQLVKSFGNNGRRLDDFSGGKRDFSNSVAVQPDGKILVGGWAIAPNGTGTMIVVRYDRSGGRDRSYGEKGVARARQCSNGQDMELLPDGQVLLAGICDSELGVVRFDEDGELDRTFAQEGVASAPINGQSTAKDMVVGPDGKITIAGETRNAVTDTYSVAMARFLPNGELDNSFNDNGHLYTTYGEDTYARGYGVDLQSDGKAIVVGEVGQSWILSRFTVDGQIDTSFGVNGVEYRGPVSVGEARAVDVLPDDRILTVGKSDDGEGFRMAAVRSFPDGETDTSFGEDGGSTQLDFGKGEDGAGAYALARDSRGRIVMAGFMVTGRNNATGELRFALARLRANGDLDPQFGGDGTVQTNVRPNFDDEHLDIAEAVAIAANNDLVAAGTSNPLVGARGPRDDFVTVRYRGERGR
ncbi:hypothetical protein HJD18_14140 [Thermoleophilia bacterium SCSIO 60948]|nr:hypothetical protein HJD18_14140 [Thermoleophilia bacterium SCSIO 60948]